MEARDLLLAANLGENEAARFLENLGFGDGSRADRCVREIGELVASRERLASLLPTLLGNLAESPDPDTAILRLQSFYESISDPTALTSYLLDNPAASRVLVRILDSSPHLSQILLRNPEYFYWLVGSDRLALKPSEEYFSEQAQFPSSLDRNSSLEWLRRFKRREILRIASQDLLGYADFRSVVRQISTLARVTLQGVFRILSPADAHDWPFAVFAFGKLGGEELNYSSDIDLLYVYSDDSEPARMLRFAKEYNQALTEFTGEGRLYRVDLRLRPMGSAGQIAYPVAAFRHYYDTAADTFDRLALIKCTRVAGSEEIANQFLGMARNFVYRRYLDLAAVDEIRWLKKRTDQKLSRLGESERNVKLGTGGIREIEFFVQSFQLLYGGLHAELRTPTTTEALDRLVDSGFLSVGDYESLKDAYFFLRAVEHRLQLVNDLQTHSLPEDPAELERCARRMGFSDGRREGAALSVFLGELNGHRSKVRRIFESLFEEPDRTGLSEIALNPSIREEEATRILAAEGVASPGEFYGGLQQIQQAVAFPYAPARMRNLLANLLPGLVANCQACPQPREFLSRFDRFCESVGARVELYRSLVEDPELASRLYRVFAAGEFLSETLIRYPELLDSVSRPPDLSLDIEEIARLQEASSPEQELLNKLCRFKRRQEFKLAVEFLESLDDELVRRELSSLAEASLRTVVLHLLSKEAGIAEIPFVFLALGKLGGSELTFHSDLDLVLIYDDRKSASTPAHPLDQFLRRLTQTLQAYTESGRLYEADFRLRPEGRRSALATPLSRFEDYFQKRAEVWEKVAYVKLRPLFSNRWSSESVARVSDVGIRPEERQLLLRIRARKEREIAREGKAEPYDFKVGRGGLMDIQFILQFHQAVHSVPATSSEEAIRELVARGILSRDRGSLLKDCLRFLFRVETVSRMLHERPVNKVSRRPEENLLLSRFLGFARPEQLLQQYEEMTESVRRVFEEELGALSD